jgi:hypothetical protein
MTGRTLENFVPMISHMGITHRGHVTNLQWPEIRKWRMRAVAIIESDGHVALNGQLEYTEKDDERRALVIDIYREFGDFEVYEYFGPEEDDVPKVRFPMVFTGVMRFYGIPKGDKAIWNRGLHECLVNETPEMKIYYLEEMVPEDGCFSNGRFSITRGHVLHAGDKAKKYEREFGIKPVVTQEDIDFVIDHGDPMPEGLGYEEGERIMLRITKLERMTKHPDPIIASRAKKLMRVVNDYPNRLLDDEARNILNPLGIFLEPRADSLIYYKGSKRLSAEWHLACNKIADNIRWALLAPPNHPRKMKKVVAFVKSHPKIVSEVKSRLEKEGLKIHPIWEVYGI